MKLLFITIHFLFFLSSLSGAEFEITLTGKYEYPYFKEYEKGKIFMLYKNDGQFTTNTSMFGKQVAAASIEFIDGQQTQNLFSHGKIAMEMKGILNQYLQKLKKLRVIYLRIE